MESGEVHLAVTLARLAFVALGLISCAPGATSPSPPSTAMVTTATAVRQPTPVPPASPTRGPQNPNASPLTPCVSSTPQPPPEDFGIEGVIAYVDRAAQQYVFIGGTPLRTAPIPFPDRPAGDVNAFLAGFSPDGKWLAYVTGRPDPELFLMGHMGALVRSSPNSLEVLGEDTSRAPLDVLQWVNERLMHLSLWAVGPNQDKIKAYALLDPFSGEWRQELLQVLPNRSPRGAVAVSPDLKRALYVQDLSHLEEGWRIDLALWDYALGRPIWRLPKVNDFLLDSALPIANLMQWSPQGNMVAFLSLPSRTQEQGVTEVQPHQVFLLMEDWQTLRQVTAFGAKNPDREAEYSLRWSPDGRYLAFGVRGVDARIYIPRRLYVYDVEAGQLVDLCPLMGQAYRSVGNNMVAWSPDSQWLAYVPFTDVGEVDPLIIINVLTGEHYRLADFAGELAGWSDKFSVPEE